MIRFNEELRRRRERRAMVRTQLRPRGIVDRRVLAAMATVPRHLFVPEGLREFAYADAPLTIGHGQTISQPFIVALMTQLLGLDRHCIVLDVGAGSGYHTAVLAKIAKHAFSIELVPELAAAASKRLTSLGLHNVTVTCGDGNNGMPDAGPFDAIVIAAATRETPPSLLEQLKPDGRMIVPLGGGETQELTLVTRRNDSFDYRRAGACRFVPFVSDNA